MFDDLALFVAIVDAGSLNAAADRLALPPATVTRRLQALEQRLGCRLLNRSARRLELTAEGSQYFDQCRPLVQALHQATSRLDGMLSQVTGAVRVLAPTNLACGPLLHAWPGFLEKYPEVSLELDLANAMQDLVGSGADLALRVGELDDSSLTQRRLASSDMVLAASPAYLRRCGTPTTLDELEAHDCIVAEPFRLWRIGDPGRKPFHPRARMRVNDLRLAVSMAVDGSGVLYCPRVQCRDELADGRLATLLDDFTGQPRHIYAVWSQQRFLPARVRALVDYLAEYMEKHPL